MIKLFFAGFPIEMQELELVQLIALYGEVSTIKIVRDKKTGKCKGYAFLEMTNAEAAGNAIRALDGKSMRRRELILKRVEEKTPVSQQPGLPFIAAQVPTYEKVDIRVGVLKKKRPRKMAGPDS